MIVKRASEERGQTRLSWLDSRHSFSFGEYYDPRHMGFGALRVINEDWVAPAGGFATHGHRDMEIVTYVIEGTLEHKQPGQWLDHSARRGAAHECWDWNSSQRVQSLTDGCGPSAADLDFAQPARIATQL